MRIRISRGWVSTKALDGTELLFPLRGLSLDITTEVEQLPREGRLEYLAEAIADAKRQQEEALVLAEQDDDETDDSQSDWTTGGDSWMQKPHVTTRATPKQYRAMAAAKLRAGFEQSSADRGQLNPGDVVDAFEGRVNEKGVLRIRTAGGWVSTKAGDGTRLLRPVRVAKGAGGSEATESDYGTGSDFETATNTSVANELAEQYRVLVTAKMREEFESTSAQAGALSVGEVVDALDGRLNENGIMRIQTERGWVNTKAGDGTRLLKPIFAGLEDEDEMTESEFETELEESEFETETTTSRGNEPAARYRVEVHAVVRAGFDPKSELRGNLLPGDVVDALDGRLNANGVMRIQTAKGWVNVKAGDGTRLLKAVAAGGGGAASKPGSEYESDEDETELAESEYETETEMSELPAGCATQYRVLKPAVLRAGFEPTSAKAGQLTPGDVLDVLDGRLNASGVMRIQTARGWVNVKAGDGTQLLQALGEEDDESGLGETEYETEYDTEYETEYDESEYETETQLSTGSGLAEQYRVLAPAMLRAGFEPTSAAAGQLTPGDVVDVLVREHLPSAFTAFCLCFHRLSVCVFIAVHDGCLLLVLSPPFRVCFHCLSQDGRMNASGIMRIQTPQGWANTQAGDGTRLLRALDGGDGGSEYETEYETDYETERETAYTYDDDSDNDSVWTTGDNWTPPPGVGSGDLTDPCDRYTVRDPTHLGL